MSIIRVHKSKNFTVMSNYHLRDKNLSLKAKGLLSVMLSLPEDWDYSISGLCSILKENKTAIKSALHELQDNGYVVVTKKFASKGNNRISYEYDIMEIPQSVDTDSLGIGFLHLEDQPQINTDKQNKEKELNVNGAKLQSNVMHDSERCAMPFDSRELSNNVNDFNFGIIRKEVITACRNYGVTDSHDIENAMCVVKYYLESFKNVFMENHPFISQSAMNGVIERFFAGSDIVECDPEVYFELIDKHFSTVYENCDYNICHFMTDGIRQNRAYEIGITA